ncbi:Na+/H+ antiporter subunit E [Kangiella aquimarina]|uniref:Na+/H+ antiporter subunit E n=1 Tax=Kangiella aquimarina TaxID=261965 RepID=A0ABZ0X3K7_9GAMM|nr:Na+/H+ antiporter subunit E [Kangiella aquimarina]WQG84954.1 Na+/H+ antiporter subunit E [Kangiella aquimarina]
MTIKSSRYTISLIIVLSLIWIGNSGFYNAMLLSFGAVSVLFVVFVAHRLNIVDEESQPLQISRRIFAYWMWLLKEIIQSNIQVIKRIWSGPKSISPVVMQLKMSQQTDMGKTIYGNSVTLTPGTVTLDIEDDVMTVYALTYDSIQYLQGGEMDRRVKRLED